MYDLFRDFLPLIAVFVGALAVYLSTTAVNNRQRTADARAVAVMLAAEIEAIMRNADARNYEEYYREFLGRFELGNFTEMPRIYGMKNDLPDIVAANVDRLGLLGPDLCYDVVSWYGHLQSITSDLIELESESVSDDQCAAFLCEDLKIWQDEVKCKAPALIERLRKFG